MDPADKRNAQAILTKVMKENNHGMSMGSVNKNLRYLSFKSLVNVHENQKESRGFILDERERGKK